MNTTRPITLKPHVSRTTAENQLRAKGVQIVFINNSMTANCKSAEEEMLVNEVNKTTYEKLWDDYFLFGEFV